ncbi:hypothetical protein ACVRZC_09695 [Streptococcus hyointestinalis]|uniref:Peptide-efflux protein n=1 Tax=Streptococcus hyointestinalis TaxID=1337 RepID=A0A380KFI3_9STRE|nr:hypothetical protein [Streptococcus hyointestinalis]SUN63741.1 peptide-efflux protein [Streptococcus hyointestinalis]
MIKFFVKNPTFRQLLLSNSFSVLGKTLFDLVFIIYAATFPNPELAVGIASIVASLPYVFSFIVGYLSDKTDNKYRYLLRTKLCQVLLYLIFAVLTLFDKNMVLFTLIIIINIISDIISTYNGYLTLSLNQKAIKADDLSYALGIQNGFYDSLSLAGRALGTLLLSLLAYNYFQFGLANAAFFALSFVFALSLRSSFPYKESKMKSAGANVQAQITQFFKDTIHNLKSLVNIKAIFKFVSLFLAMNFVSSGLYSLMTMTLVGNSSLLIGNLALTLTIIEVVEVSSSIIGSLFPLKWYRDLKLEYNILAELLFTVLLIVSLGYLSNIGLVLLSSLFIGYLGGVSNPKITSLILQTVPEERQNSIFSIYSTLITLTVPMAASLIVAINSVFGSTIAFFLLLLIVLICLVYLVNRLLKEVLTNNKRANGR